MRVRTGELSDAKTLMDELSATAQKVSALHRLVDYGWASDFIRQVEYVVGQGTELGPADLAEPYFGALDLLSAAARHPLMRPLTDGTQISEVEEAAGIAREGMTAALVDELTKLVILADYLTPESDSSQWFSCRAVGEEALGLVETGGPILGKVGRSAKQVAKTCAKLRSATAGLSALPYFDVLLMTPH